MKHKISFVTCIYDDMHNTEFAGRHNRGSHYVFSLAQIQKMAAPISCFTDKRNMLKFFPALLYCGYENMRFINYNLDEYPNHQDIMRVKRAKQELYIEGVSWRQRCVEIMWAKFDWLIHILEEGGKQDSMEEYTFWIDGGLSHEGIFPRKYNTIHSKRKYHTKADEYHDRFMVNKVFNPNFPDYLVDAMEDRDLIFFFCTMPQHSDPNHWRANRRHVGTAAGGLFGGRNKVVYEWAKEGQKHCRDLLNNDFLLKEEDILTHMINLHAEKEEDFDDKVKLVKFKTWYHEDWDVYNPEESSFSDFFKGLE